MHFPYSFSRHPTTFLVILCLLNFRISWIGIRYVKKEAVEWNRDEVRLLYSRVVHVVAPAQWLW